jgi:hypothetical protein
LALQPGFEPPTFLFFLFLSSSSRSAMPDCIIMFLAQVKPEMMTLWVCRIFWINCEVSMILNCVFFDWFYWMMGSFADWKLEAQDHEGDRGVGFRYNACLALQIATSAGCRSTCCS